MATIPFLANKEVLREALMSADKIDIVEAIQVIDADEKWYEANPASPTGSMSIEERKQKYKDFSEVLREVAQERFSQDELLQLFRVAKKS